VKLERRRDAFAQVLQLGALAPREDPGRAIDAVVHVGADRAAELLRRHKVVDLALARLTAPGVDAGDFSGRLAAAGERAIAMRERYAEVEQRLEEGVAASDVAVYRMKGSLMRELYPEPALRHAGDLDVFVKTDAEAWELADALRARGAEFSLTEPPWVKLTTAGVAYGNIPVIVNVRDLAVAIDIHYGRYSVRHAASIECPTTESPFRSLSLEANVAAMLANAAGDCFVTQKDLNDLVAADRHGVDWDEAGSLIRGAGLAAFASVAARRAVDTMEVSDRLRNFERSIRSILRHVDAPPLREPSWRLRWLQTCVHSASLPGLARHRLRRTASAAIYYWPRFSLHLTERDRGQRTPTEVTCVRYAPVPGPRRAGGPDEQSLTKVGHFGVVELWRHHEFRVPLARGGGDWFVPTVFYDVPQTAMRWLGRPASVLEPYLGDDEPALANAGASSRRG
jgi:hypothetical protein